MSEHEKPLPGPAAVAEVLGRPVDYSTFYRWTTAGISVRGERVRLDFVKCGRGRRTTIGAVRDFRQRCTTAAGGFSAPNEQRLSRQTETAHQRAERELRAAGF